jgi:Protein of unknown function (DUF3592)
MEGLGGSFMQSVLVRFQTLGVAGREALFGARVGQRWIFRSNAGYLGREKLTDYSILWISALALVLGLGILMKSGGGQLLTHSPAAWPTTSGTINSVRVVERNYGSETRWFAEVSYQYSVHGRTIANTRLARGPETSWRDSAEANQFLERYIARSQVLVYYNPNNINEAVLDPTGGLELSTWIGIFMIAFALGILVVYDRLT